MSQHQTQSRQNFGRLSKLKKRGIINKSVNSTKNLADGMNCMTIDDFKSMASSFKAQKLAKSTSSINNSLNGVTSGKRDKSKAGRIKKTILSYTNSNHSVVGVFAVSVLAMSMLGGMLLGNIDTSDRASASETPQEVSQVAVESEPYELNTSSISDSFTPETITAYNKTLKQIDTYPLFEIIDTDKPASLELNNTKLNLEWSDTGDIKYLDSSSKPGYTSSTVLMTTNSELIDNIDSLAPMQTVTIRGLDEKGKMHDWEYKVNTKNSYSNNETNFLDTHNSLLIINPLENGSVSVLDLGLTKTTAVDNS